MTDDRPSAPADGGQRKRPGDRGNEGWTVFSYLISGMAAYGGIGWLIGHWTGHPLLFPLGMLFGLAVSIGLVIHRYGRS
jgi:ATP synthase protein I